MSAQPAEREYKMRIDPKILRLLGPSLYTNIYYVLAELIANAYDADAENVYIISDADSIIVEDDGSGMSYTEGDVDKYLNVAEETRTTSEDSLTPKWHRRKIGRKGIGKLSALSVSEKILVKTVKNSEKSGFIFSRELKADGSLESLKDKEINFKKIVSDGTSIVMEQPHYELNKTLSVVKKNLLNIFPLVNEHFKIHLLLSGQEEVVIDSFNKEMIEQLGGFIAIGKDFHYLSEFFTCEFPEKQANLLKKYEEKEIAIELVNNDRKKKTYNLVIKGWIGVYKSTRGKKTEMDEFPDNFISLFSNNKLGEYNILPTIGKNRLNEVYVVGQLHIDLFEETELPDMALSNRQGYKTDDPRYKAVLEFASQLLVDVVEMRVVYAVAKNKDRANEKLKKQKEQEGELRRQVDGFKKKAADQASRKIANVFGFDDVGKIGKAQKIIETEVGACSSLIGIKNVVDAQKRKILLSHKSTDKILADIIYNMLVFNNVPPEDIIYTSCDDEVSRIPDSLKVLDYLRDFFVESYSTQKIYVIYVTSKEMACSWYTVAEVGAGWITRIDHEVFNIHDHKPEPPLDTGRVWHTSIRDVNRIKMINIECDRFAIKIEGISNSLGYRNKTRAQNNSELARYIDII